LLAFSAGNLLSAGTFLALLADNTLLFTFGCVLSTFAAYGIRCALHPPTKPPWSAFAGELLLIAAFFLLFWSLGGTTRNPGPTPPGTPSALRVVSIPSPLTGSTKSERSTKATGQGRGTLTLTDVPGVNVMLDQGTTAWQRTPFAHVPLWNGSHTLKISAQKGREEIATGSFRIAEGDDTRLVVLGPSFAFGAIATTLRLSASSDLTALAARRFPPWLRSISSLHVVLGLAAFGCWLRMGASRWRRVWVAETDDSFAWLPSFFALTVGSYLMARLAFLWLQPPSPGVVLLGVLGAAGALLPFVRAARISPPLAAIPWQQVFPFLFLMALGSVALSSVGSSVSFALSGLTALGASLLSRLPWSDPQAPVTAPIKRALLAPTFAVATLTLAPCNLLLLTAFATLLQSSLSSSFRPRWLWVALLALSGLLSVALWKIHNSMVASTDPVTRSPALHTPERAATTAGATTLLPAGVIRIGSWLLVLPWALGSLRLAWLLLGQRFAPRWVLWWYLPILHETPSDPARWRVAFGVVGLVLLGILGWYLQRPRPLSTGPVSSR